MNHVIIIGGAAVDITGRPDSISRLRDSNIGLVRISPGGVSKNIAKRLAGWGVETELITAIGKGYHGQLILEDCKASGVEMENTYICDQHTGTYLSVLDEEGDLLVGINDMKILTTLTPDYFAPLIDQLNQADMVSLDGNLEPATLDYLTNSITAPVFYDPVSCAKATRIGGNIGKCFAIKPNRYEAGFLSGKSCDTERGIYRAAEWFFEQGVPRVFISMGAEGLYWGDRDNCGVLPSACREVVDTTGAGDAMSAAIIAGCIRGLSTEECAVAGSEASAKACSIRGWD